ncbi:MAG: nicotinamide mononucleotide transporter [Arenicella sp.]|jgi:nicotinamide mononucleotide transporter
MNDFLIGLKEGIIQTSWIEWVAVLTGITYVILAARKSIFCWSFALASAGFYVYICYDYNLYLESFLQLFYVLMAIAGWYFWNATKDREELIQKWRLDFHALNIGVSAVACLVLGYYFDHETAQAYPYLDAFTTVFSLAATYMVTQRVIENWLYWIVIDIAGVFLYGAKGLYLSAVLYFIFTVLAVIGYIHWRKKFKLQLA